ncbi:MAG: hypothetical protein IT210_25070 [Armatimonadetes bacterium]|nr:hypothetical protein [Armatimonadota bacterium]
MAGRKILRDAPVPAKVATTVSLDAARNEYEPFQVMITALNRDLSRVEVSATDLKSAGGGIVPARHIELRLAHYILLKDAVKPSSPGGWYPDALLPLKGAFSVARGNHQAVWGNVYVPPRTPAGLYNGAVRVDVNGAIHTVPIRLRVRDFALPVENHFGSAFAIWPGFLADAYGLKAGSPEFRALYDRTYWFLTGYRLPPDDLPVPADSPQAARYLNDPRVTSYRIPYNPNEPEAFRKRVAYLRQKGWLSKGYIYTIDEPGPEAFAECYQYGKRIDAIAPDAKWLLTAAPSPVLHGAVDIWCPDLAYINLEDLRKRQLIGEKVWWYTCVVPPQPYPTYFINDDATSHRVMSWLQSAWNIQGVLYWAVNIWGKYDGTKYVG